MKGSQRSVTIACSETVAAAESRPIEDGQLENLSGAPTLTELCSLIVDSEHKTAPKDPEGEHPLMRTTDLGVARGDFGGAQRISADTYDLWTRRARPQEGDLILAREAPVGGICRVPAGIQPALGQRTVLLRPNPAVVDSRFLMYRLAAPDLQARVNEAATGATVPHLNMADIRALRIPNVPELGEQRRRAALLSAIDEAVEINERRARLLVGIGRALYGEWFERFRYPDCEPETVTTDLGRFPADWAVKRLGDVCSVIQAGRTPPRSDPANWDGGTINWFKTGELRDGPLTGSVERVVPRSNVRLFQPPMIFMAIYGSPTVGRLGWVTEPCSCNQAALGLRANNAQEAQEWLWYQLEALRGQFNRMAQGAAQQNISKEKVANTLVAVPPASVLKRFAESVGPLRELSVVLKRTNEALQRSRDLLLPRLITGRVDLSEVDFAHLLGSEDP